MYKCLEESKDYLEDDLRDAQQFYFTDDEYRALADAIDDIQNKSVTGGKATRARLEPQRARIEMPHAQAWKVDENLTEFIKITEVQQ